MITQCNPGFANCDGQAFNGCETNTQTSVSHCGACNAVCTPVPNAVRQCVNGTCTMTCNVGFSDCDGLIFNGCEVAGNCIPQN